MKIPLQRSCAGPVAGFLALAALLSGCQSGKTEGQKQVDQLTSQLEDFKKTLTETKADLQATLAEHDAVVANKDGDLVGHYAKFVDGLESCEEHQQEIRADLERIQTTAAPYFAKWQQDMAMISDEDLRESSEERMKDTQERLQEMQENGAKARDECEPLMRTLRDHATYLSSDLNASAAASLSKDASKLSKSSEAAFALLDAAIAVTQEFQKSIAMRTEPPAEPK